MHIAPFATEQFFDLYEFKTPHLLSPSDCATVNVQELLQMAGLTLENLGDLKLGYTQAQGHPELRRLIAADYEQVIDEEVVVLTSPIEGIYLTMRTLLDKEDEAIVLTPAYDALKNMAEHICHQVHLWPLQPVDDTMPRGWRLDFEALQGLINPKTKLIVVNFPHNPTGFLPTPDDLTRLLETAQAHDIWLFSDEIYRGLEFGDRAILSSVADQYERSIILSGLSKIYGLPGLRAGWMVIKDSATRQALINWKHYTTICPAAPTEFLAMAALQVKEKLIEQNQTIIRDNLRLAVPFFDRWSNFFTWRPPLAGSVALVGIDVPSATTYCHDLAQKVGILLLPSAFLGYDDRHIRFGFGRTSFATALNYYEDYLSSCRT